MATQQESQTVSRLFLFRDERSSVSGPCWDTVVNYSVENTHNYSSCLAVEQPHFQVSKKKNRSFLLRKAKKKTILPLLNSTILTDIPSKTFFGHWEAKQTQMCLHWKKKNNNLTRDKHTLPLFSNNKWRWHSGPISAEIKGSTYRVY